MEVGFSRPDSRAGPRIAATTTAAAARRPALQLTVVSRESILGGDEAAGLLVFVYVRHDGAEDAVSLSSHDSPSCRKRSPHRAAFLLI